MEKTYRVTVIKNVRGLHEPLKAIANFNNVNELLIKQQM